MCKGGEKKMRTISAQWLRMNTRSSSVGRGTRASYLRLVLIVAFALALPGSLWYPTFAAQAGRIDSIAPSCASVGAPVMITGIGFGDDNVQITVDGVPAQVMAATGNQATFIVPAGVSLGTTTVAAMNPGGQVGSIAFKVCDLLLPDAWAGKWTFTITSRKAATGSITSVRESTTSLRTGEPFGMALVVAKLASCTGAVTATNLDVHCTAQTTGTCTASGDVEVVVTRTGETITGMGASTLTVAGDCGPFASSAETIEIAGQRLSLDQGTGAGTTLLLNFVPHAALLSRVQ